MCIIICHNDEKTIIVMEHIIFLKLINYYKSYMIIYIYIQNIINGKLYNFIG